MALPPNYAGLKLSGTFQETQHTLELCTYLLLANATRKLTILRPGLCLPGQFVYTINELFN